MGFLEAILNWNFSILETDFFVGLMLYPCLRHWPIIKKTLRRRFVFDAFTTVSSMLKFSILKGSTVHIKHLMLVQC